MIETEIENEQTLLGFSFFKFKFQIKNKEYLYNLSLKEDNGLSAYIIKNLQNNLDLYLSDMIFKGNILLKASVSYKKLGIKIKPISIILKNSYKKEFKELFDFKYLIYCSCFGNNPRTESKGGYNFYILDDIYKYFYENKQIFPLFATTYLNSRDFIFDKRLFIYNNIYEKPIFIEPLVEMKLYSYDDVLKIKNNTYKKAIQFFHNQNTMELNKAIIYIKYSLLSAKCIYVNSILEEHSIPELDSIIIEDTPQNKQTYFMSYFNPITYFNSKDLNFEKFILETEYINNKHITIKGIKINHKKLQNTSFHPSFEEAKKATLYKISQTIQSIKPFFESQNYQFNN